MRTGDTVLRGALVATMLGAVWLATSSVHAQQASARDDELHVSDVVSEAARREWAAGRWESAFEINAGERVRSDDTGRRVIASALVLRVPYDAVSGTPVGPFDWSLRELEAIESQRTVAQVLGAVGVGMMPPGILFGATANVIDEFGLGQALLGWGLLGIGGILGIVALVLHVDVSNRWQRWAARLPFE
jgi:hypothetical protein